MKQAWIVFLFIFGIFFQPVFASVEVFPELFITHSRVFDETCSRLRNEPISFAAQSEALLRIPEFQGAWDEMAGLLLPNLYREFGYQFSRRELSVTTTVCRVASLSSPFLINLRPYLLSLKRKDVDLSPMLGFVDLVFHEFLHNYLVEYDIYRKSNLIKKYQKEAPGVKSHLHLIAIQVHLYLRLGLTDYLLWIEERNKNICGDYERAWNIVQEEGAQAFIQELLENPPTTANPVVID